MMRLLLFISSSTGLLGISAMPAPWTRELSLTNPPMSGNDVIIAQNLLLRDAAVTSFKADGIFGDESEKATKDFQAATGLTASGIFDDSTADKLLGKNNIRSNY